MAHDWKIVKEGRLADHWQCTNCGYLIVYAVKPEEEKKLWVEHDGSKQISEASFTCEEMQLFMVHND